jgi:hypothetical protein
LVWPLGEAYFIGFPLLCFTGRRGFH